MVSGVCYQFEAGAASKVVRLAPPQQALSPSIVNAIFFYNPVIEVVEINPQRVGWVIICLEIWRSLCRVQDGSCHTSMCNATSKHVMTMTLAVQEEAI